MTTPTRDEISPEQDLVVELATSIVQHVSDQNQMRSREECRAIAWQVYAEFGDVAMSQRNTSALIAKLESAASKP